MAADDPRAAPPAEVAADEATPWSCREAMMLLVDIVVMPGVADPVVGLGMRPPPMLLPSSATAAGGAVPWEPASTNCRGDFALFWQYSAGGRIYWSSGLLPLLHRLSSRS